MELLTYEAWCQTCGCVTPHNFGQGMRCEVGFPRRPLEPVEVTMAEAIVMRARAKRRR